MSRSIFGLISLLMMAALMMCGGCSQDSSTGPGVDSSVSKTLSEPGPRNVFIAYYGDRPDDLLATAGVMVKRQYKYIPAVYATVSDEGMARLNGDPRVRFVEEEGYKYPAEDPLDWDIAGTSTYTSRNHEGNRFPDEQVLDWGVDRIDAEYVHAVSGNRGAGVNVAVLDSGGDIDHEDLNWAGGIRVEEGADPLDWNDKNGHGTHCSGIISANDNEIGVVGVAPDCNLYMVAIFSANWINTASMVAGLEWCLGTHYDDDPYNDIQIMSMSVCGPESWVEDMYYQACYDDGILLIAAAGNDDGAVSWPAAYPCVMAISGTTAWDGRYYVSNFGPEIELAAPGHRIYSTYPKDMYKTMSGTSMACPMVAGTAACIWSDNPTWTHEQVREHMKSTAEWMPNLLPEEQGSGLVDVENAVLGTTNGNNYVAPE